VRLQPTVSAVDLRELHGGIVIHLLHLGPCKVAPRVGADVRQPVPLVHPKLPDADFDVQSVVVVLVHVPLGQVLSQHVLVDFLAALDLGDQPPARFRKVAQRIAEEVLPPFVMVVVRSRRPLAGAETDEDADLPSRPFIHGRLIEDLGRRVVRPRALVDEDVLADLDRFECETGSARRPARLPDRAVEFRRRFFSRVVRSQQSRRPVFGCPFVHGGDSTV